jgi:hypothetical protein
MLSIIKSACRISLSRGHYSNYCTLKYNLFCYARLAFGQLSSDVNASQTFTGLQIIAEAERNKGLNRINIVRNRLLSEKQCLSFQFNSPPCLTTHKVFKTWEQGLMVLHFVRH